MSFIYPKRVKELPVLETDSEDELDAAYKNKPEAKAQDVEQSDKENVVNKVKVTKVPERNSTKSYVFPKRSSELPALESDTDEEDSLRRDKLNCAILNDSFIESPLKANEDNDSHQNLAHESLMARFDRMALKPSAASNQSSNKGQEMQPGQTRPTILQRLSSRAAIGEVEEKASTTIKAAAKTEAPQQRLAGPAAAVSRLELETPFKSSATGANEPASKTINEELFVTPQVDCVSKQRGARAFCSTQTGKARNAAAAADSGRFQKVLFQTPLHKTRVPINLQPNDSISLSLCDTINEQSEPTTPIAAEQPKPVTPPDRALAEKAKKALDEAFKQTDRMEHPVEVPLTRAQNFGQAKAQANPTSSTMSSGTASAQMTAASTAKENILQINNSKYGILRKLGAGGSSSVYLGQHKQSGKECAIKIVDLRGDAAVVEGYLNETKLLAKLQGNPCVVSLYEYQLLQQESRLYMVMEKGDTDLRNLLQTYNTHLPLYMLTKILYQMLQAVNYIHQNGVIHSDLKPANFLMVNGRLKLIDFGIASNIALDSTSIIKFTQAGTFNYISPEALIDTSTGNSPSRNQLKIKISTKSDVWSLGCILYLLLYKRTPFGHILNIHAKICAITSNTPCIEYADIPIFYPAMLVEMAKRCLQRNPKERPSCAELLQFPFHMIIPAQHLNLATN